MGVPPEKSPERSEEAPLRAEELVGWMAQYGPALRQYFSRKAGPADADDLVQEVFLRLQARSRGAPVENVERYLFKIAKHVLVNRYRAQREHDELSEEHEETDDLSPERILAAKQEFARAVVAILALPPRTRAAFQFHRFEKLSYSAIAKRMGISKGTVQDLMQRAIDKLTDEIGGDT